MGEPEPIINKVKYNSDHAIGHWPRKKDVEFKGH